MNLKTAKMASEWVQVRNGDIEKTARWMRDTLRIGSMKENRHLLAEALEIVANNDKEALEIVANNNKEALEIVANNDKEGSHAVHSKS